MPDTPAAGRPEPAEIEILPAGGAGPAGDRVRQVAGAGGSTHDPGLPWSEESDDVAVSATPGNGPDRRSSRRRRVLLGTALAVGLLGAAGIGTVGWRVVEQKDVTLETPDQVAGLVRDDSERARETAEYLRTGFAADIDLRESLGAVYSDPAAADRGVLLFGGTALLWQPGQDLERLFELVADDGESVQGLRELPAGDLGGVLKCGVAPADEGDIAVCGWADHGSVVLAMFPGRQVDEAAELLRDIRSEIQHRR